MSIKTDLQIIKNCYSLEQLTNLKKLFSSDKIAAKMAFNMLVDMLEKDCTISQKTAENIYISRNKRGDIVINCKSYTVKLI